MNLIYIYNYLVNISSLTSNTIYVIMLIIYLKELRRLQQERRAEMKYPHTSSRKSMARLGDEIKL